MKPHVSLAVVLLLLIAGAGQAQVTATPYPALPYIPGASYGPIGPIQNPLTEQDYIAYAGAYWAWYDSGFTDATALESFQFGHPGLLPYATSAVIGTSGNHPVDVDPFGRGKELFEELYQHRLNTSFGFDQLIASDPLVRASWRHWTFTRQVFTADWVDPVAHFKHIIAVVDSFITHESHTSRGVPYYDGPVLVSDRTKKKKPITGVTPPTPIDVTGLPPDIQILHTHLCATVGVLSGFPGLYTPDGGPDSPGFDCDDFADALGHYCLKNAPVTGATTSNKYVSWTTSGGADVAHLVTVIHYGGYYWILDAQTGIKLGPFADGTPFDATGIITGGYDIAPDSTPTTSQTCYAPGDRGAWTGEPPPWYTDPDVVDHFENITGLDASCFAPVALIATE